MGLSDNALRFWMGYFLLPGNTLRFGGDQAEMEITPEARTALDELLSAGAVKPIAPDDQWPGSEHYGATDMDLRAECRSRAMNPFNDTASFITFRKKAAQSN